MTTRHTPAALSVVIGAGGTGGHIYPGLALAEALRAAVPGAVVSFIGTERGLETELIPGAYHRLHTVDMIPFDPALGAKRYLLPAALLRSAHQARSVIRAQGAHVVVGMGGYPSAPAVLGARLAGLLYRDPRVQRGTRPRQPVRGPAHPARRGGLRPQPHGIWRAGRGR